MCGTFELQAGASLPPRRAERRVPMALGRSSCPQVGHSPVSTTLPAAARRIGGSPLDEPSQAESGRVEESWGESGWPLGRGESSESGWAEASRAGRAGSGRIGPRRVESSRVRPGWGESGRVEASSVEPHRDPPEDRKYQIGKPLVCGGRSSAGAHVKLAGGGGWERDEEHGLTGHSEVSTCYLMV